MKIEYKLLAGVLALLSIFACQKKEETNCAEDIVCSYLLLEAVRVGTLSVSGNRGALNNAQDYTVNVFRSTDCSGVAVRSASFSETSNPTVLSASFDGLSSGAYTVSAFKGATSICSNSFSFGAVKSTASCEILTSTISCR